MILAELGDLSRFGSPAAVANYAGLVPRDRDSNDKRWSGHITRRGSAHLRGVLIEAAWMAAPRVPVYRALFDRARQKKNKKTAIVAVARRMLEDAWMWLIKDQAFRYVPAFLGDTQSDATSLAPCHEHQAEWIPGTRFLSRTVAEFGTPSLCPWGLLAPDPSASIPSGKGADANRRRLQMRNGT